MIGAHAQHRIRPKASGDQVRIGARHPGPCRDQREVLVERFRNGGIDRKACRGIRSSRLGEDDRGRDKRRDDKQTPTDESH